ncbi:unnamed protein product, partial [Prorocentrum cordatum]
MVSRLMEALSMLSIHFVVAPYEADAQLAFMCRVGWVHAVISEDSDLLAYGCPNTFFKMDKYGDGQRIALPCLQPGHAVDGPDPADDEELPDADVDGEEGEGSDQEAGGAAGAPGEEGGAAADE